MVEHGPLCGIAIVSSENSFGLLLDMEPQRDEENLDWLKSKTTQSNTNRLVLSVTDDGIFTCFPPLCLQEEQRKRGKDRSRTKENTKPDMKKKTSIYHCACCETWDPLCNPTPSGGTHQVLSATVHSCRLSYGWREAEMLTAEAFSHIYRCESPSHWLPGLP